MGMKKKIKKMLKKRAKKMLRRHGAEIAAAVATALVGAAAEAVRDGKVKPGKKKHRLHELLSEPRPA